MEAMGFADGLESCVREKDESRMTQVSLANNGDDWGWSRSGRKLGVQCFSC